MMMEKLMFTSIIHSVSLAHYNEVSRNPREGTEMKLQTCACCSSVVFGEGGLERWPVVWASIHKQGIHLVQDPGN